MPRFYAIAAGLGLLFAASRVHAQSATCANPNILQTFTNNSAAGTTTGVIQSFAVPSNQVTIDALGAQGGTNEQTGGLGAEVVATVAITPGQILCVLVGVQGGNMTNAGFGAGGGGGTFVYAISSGTCASNLAQVTTGGSPNLLIAAAGGGGGGNETPGKKGLAPTGAGTAGASTGGTGDGNGATGGTAGSGGHCLTNSGGGGGLLTGGSTCNQIPGGQALIQGAVGGALSGTGGYGGGGGGSDTGGGGGGYNGGGGGGIGLGGPSGIGGGGGGGSFSGTTPLSPFTQDGVRMGNGVVTLCYAPIPGATHFSVSAPGTATAGVPFNFTVTAQDASNNTVTGYNGTVHFTSIDGAASLPPDTMLTNGTGTFSATLRTPGNQTITASDMANSLSGTSGGILVSVTTGAIHLLGAGVCPAGSNWSNPACWDLNRAPATGDDVVIAGSAQASTNDDLGAGVMLHSLTISGASGPLVITGGPIGLQSGATVTDSITNGGTDSLPGIALNGPAGFAVSAAGETLQITGAITGAFALTKTGAGVLLLAGANTYSGSTTVSGGTLSVTGSLASSPVSVGSGATLLGTGTVLSIAVQSGGTLTGNLTATAGTTFAAGSIFRVMIASGPNFTQLLGGTANLTAGPTLTVSLAGGFTPTVGTAFSIIPGAVSGTFNGLPNGAQFASGGVVFRINYASATLTVIGSTTGVPTLSWPGLAILAILLAWVAMRVMGRHTTSAS